MSHKFWHKDALISMVVSQFNLTYKIEMHPPKVLAWAKEEAQKRDIDYQKVINEILLERIS
jgi:predicted DNA binding CopG/RHH family protein